MMKQLLLVFALIVAFGPAGFGDDGGAVPIRIADGPGTRCISGSKDRIWLTMRRVITDKNSSWLKEDKSVAVIATTLVKSDPAAPKALSFPLMTEATVAPYSKGQVSVPIEYSLIDGFSLVQDKVKYTGLQLEFTLLNVQGRNNWGNALLALGQVAKKLPLPASPYTQAASYLLDFTNTAVTKDLDAQDKSDKVKSATITLNFDPDGKCVSQDFESTGTIAILQGGQPKGDFFVDLGQINNYCWTAELRPAFVLKAATRDAQRTCTDPQYHPQWKQVTNNYVAFFLNAVATTGKLGPPVAADRKAAVARCSAHGISEEDCLK
jgi:hypothetical protein